MERAALARLLGGGVGTHGRARVRLAESDPRNFMAAFARAVAGEGEIFLCNPDWGRLELTQVDALLGLPGGPDRSPTGESGLATPKLQRSESGLAAPKLHRSEGGWLMIPTGGSSGRVRFARHDAASIAAAVRGFTQHFSVTQVNAMGVLPLHHVSGLMAWMRCVLTGGEYLPLDWKAVEAGKLPRLPAKPQGWMISLVPTQLERLLRQEPAVDWLRGFRVIFLGGGPAWPGLLDQAAAQRLPLSPGYGMTESAAMVAALRPGEFLAGARSCGPILPHVALQVGAEGEIVLRGESLFRGYYPAWREQPDFETEDAGWLDAQGQLHVTGRRDSIIITGGEKVDPVEIEAALRDCGEFSDVVVLGVPDDEWGRMIVAAFPAEARPDLEKVKASLSRLLAPAKRPKRYVALPDWPANAQGKVNRAEILRRVVALA